MPDPVLPYPPSPVGIPPDFGKPRLRYRLHVLLALLALFVFLGLYLVLLAATLGLMFWAILPPPVSDKGSDHWAVFLFSLAIRGSIFAVSAMLFVFLFKGFFKRDEDDTSHYLEITERQQPMLFQFLRALCQEIGSPFPPKVYLSHDVNAAVFFSTSILNLFIPPRKSLLIGLGLVNDLNLVEFKALLAHELGHFSQRSLRLSGYVRVVHRIVYHLVYTRDRWDDWVIRGLDLPWVSAFAALLYGLVEMTRSVLKAIHHVLNLAHLSLLRQMEFNADLVAVSVAGSDAPVHALLKSEFGQATLDQAARDLSVMADQRIWSKDVFYHQHQTSEIVRILRKNPTLGQPPELPADLNRSVQVFQPDDSNTVAMWADHPSPYDRESNAKRKYFRGPHDDRPAWVLFQDQAAVREEITRRFYRTAMKLEPDVPLTEPASVQALIDEERVAGTFDPRYHGVYDQRFMVMDDLIQRISAIVDEATPSPEQLSVMVNDLYSDQLAARVAGHRQRHEEFAFLKSLSTCRRKPTEKEFEFRGESRGISEARQLEAKVGEELDEDFRFFAEFDSSVFALTYHLAGFLGKREELGQRYQFHLKLLWLMGTLQQHEGPLEALCVSFATRKKVHWEEFWQMLEVLRQARESLVEVLGQARTLFPPPLKRMNTEEPIGRFLPDKPCIPHLPKGLLVLEHKWAHDLYGQIVLAFDKLNRIQLKSMAGILAFQEQLAREWQGASAARVN